MATKTSSTKVRKTKDGTVDKRTKEGKEIAERMAKLRKAKEKKAKAKTSTVKRTKDGTLDKRTKEGKEAAARMAKARAAKGSLKNRIKRIFK